MLYKQLLNLKIPVPTRLLKKASKGTKTAAKKQRLCSTQAQKPEQIPLEPAAA